MKTSSICYLIIVPLILMSCGTSKQSHSQLHGQSWQLDYISGPRIAFEGLYPDKKPTISFDKQEKRVTGMDSCNGYSADYTLNGTSIAFGEPGPTTMMYCGDGDVVFRKAMQEIDNYSFDSDGRLVLKKGDVMMLRFSKE